MGAETWFEGRYILDEELQHIARRMMSEGEKTIAYFKVLPTESWKQQIYTTGSGWTIRQVLAHFVSAELGLSALVRDVIADGGGAPHDFDIDEFNENEVAGLQALEISALLLSLIHI